MYIKDVYEKIPMLSLEMAGAFISMFDVLNLTGKQE